MCVFVCVRVCVPRVFISLIDTTSVGSWVAVGRSNDKYCDDVWCWCLIWYIVVLYYFTYYHFFLCFRLAGSVEDPPTYDTVSLFRCSLFRVDVCM